MSGEAAGWVKTIRETTYGSSSVWSSSARTRRISSAAVVTDAESTIETIADGMAAHARRGRELQDRSPSVGRSIFRRDVGAWTRWARFYPRGEHLQQRNAAASSLKAACGPAAASTWSGLKLGLYIRLRLVSVGSLAAVAVIAVRRQEPPKRRKRDRVDRRERETSGSSAST
jgi:hypothetical protein